MKLLEQAVRLGRDSFTELKLDIFDQFRRIRLATDIKSEVDKLSTPNPLPPHRPRIGLDNL